MLPFSIHQFIQHISFQIHLSQILQVYISLLSNELLEEEYWMNIQPILFLHL